MTIPASGPTATPEAGGAAPVHDLADSVADLFRGVERREPFHNPDGRSAAGFERVWIGGRRHVVKYLHVDDDFTMRVSGDVGCRPVQAWAAGCYDAAPGLIDHAVVGAALGHGRNGWGGALLMRDVSEELFPTTPEPYDGDQHATLIDHLAGRCAATWDYRDEGTRGPRLLPYATRWAWFGHAALEGERLLGWPERVPAVAAEGWSRFAERAPAAVVSAVEDLRHDVTPLADALRRTPSCLLHGDPKASNMGVGADGRTVLIDWAYVGEGPACHELAWHLALDRDKLPISKEATIEAFCDALRRHGVATDGWWQAQLELCLLGALLQFGWEKAFGEQSELGWWCAAASRGLARL